MLVASSDHLTNLASIRERLLDLPGDPVVRTGHGPEASIAAESGIG